MTAFHHSSSKHLKKLLEMTVCSSSPPNFVVVTQTIPEIFDRECLGNSSFFSSSAHTISQNLGFKIQDLDKVLDMFVATYPHCRIPLALQHILINKSNIASLSCQRHSSLMTPHRHFNTYETISFSQKHSTVTTISFLQYVLLTLYYKLNRIYVR